MGWKPSAIVALILIAGAFACGTVAVSPTSQSAFGAGCHAIAPLV
jgi:hypothetical protein